MQVNTVPSAPSGGNDHHKGEASMENFIKHQMMAILQPFADHVQELDAHLTKLSEDLQQTDLNVQVRALVRSLDNSPGIAHPKERYLLNQLLDVWNIRSECVALGFYADSKNPPRVDIDWSRRQWTRMKIEWRIQLGLPCNKSRRHLSISEKPVPHAHEDCQNGGVHEGDVISPPQQVSCEPVSCSSTCQARIFSANAARSRILYI